MILRRLATAIRKQDWFTVFIETLIVVLGVFLGLQVNNWNEARKDRLEAETSRERLIADLHADLDALFFEILDIELTGKLDSLI